MAFMQPDIQRTDYFRVDTNIGTETVPADLVAIGFPVAFKLGESFDADSPHFSALCEALRQYCEGGSITGIDARTGYLARLSAPGYMDCTDWSAHDSEQEARAYLDDMYGENE